MNRRPLIGITARKIAFFHQERPYHRYGVPIAYLEAVEDAGGTPLMIPPSSKPEVLLQTYGMLDGLLLPGGHDVDPIHYGEEPSPKLEAIDQVRDATELLLAKKAMDDGLPLFGVCRGCQVINVAAGGSLHQDLATTFGKPIVRHFQQHVEEGPSHFIDVEAGSRLAEIAGAARVRVNTYHHQAVNRLGAGLKITARATDGVVEAIETVDPNRFVLGVQWHPELLASHRDVNLKVFEAHVAAARDRR